MVIFQFSGTCFALHDNTQIFAKPIFAHLCTFTGGQTKLPAPQTLAGGTKGRHPSDKGGVLFGRSESFKTNEHLGK